MANNPFQLYKEADESGIDVIWMPLHSDQSMAIQFDDGECAIGIDPWKMDTLAQETVSMAHELGHCATGSFYSRYSPFDVRQKHENRADKWAIKKLIPEDELNATVANGRTEAWELAEEFCVTEDFMKKAMHWYKHGNLAVELYA